MRFEELRVKWKQARPQDFLDAGKINLRILDPGMVAVNEQRSQSKERKKKEIFELQTLGSLNGLRADTFSKLLIRIVHAGQRV